jgi:predicted alpha/beta superfamily hydrolase
MNCRVLLIIIFTAFISACNGGSSDNNNDFQKVDVIDEQDIHSHITNVTYKYTVHLPEGYEDTNKNFPVIYVTDGQWDSGGILAGVVEASQKDIIIVGITEGPLRQRDVDFLLPGSSQYIDFLALEMLPLVESQYRIDSSNRTLCGWSYGGLLVRHALLNEVNRPLFQNFIAIDGSFFYKDNTYRELEADAYNTMNLDNRKLYLAGANFGNGQFVRTFNDTIRSYGLLDFTVYYQQFYLTHEDVVLAAMRDSVDRLFP